MYRDAVTPKQLTAWLAAAQIPVAVQLAAGHVTWAVALGAGACFLATLAVWNWGNLRGWLSIPAYLLLIIYVGQLLRESAEAWTGNSYPAVPLILLALALWSALKGAAAAARVGCVLFWAVLLVYPTVLWEKVRDGIPSANPQYINVSLYLLLLLPTMGKSLRKKEEGAVWKLSLPGILAIVGAILAGNTDFYEMVRGMDFMGTVQHFDALISATATLGWFALLSYSLSLCGALGQGKGSVIMGALAITGWMLCDMHISYPILLIMGSIFWVFLPLLTQGIEREKNL